MQAIVQHRYGPPDVLSLADVPTPEPGTGEVRVRILATSVNAGDWHLMRASPFLIRVVFGGLFTPKIRTLGADIAGRVEAVGANVTRFRPGDEVFGDVSDSGFGAFAEYACAPEGTLAPKPAGTTFEEAAAVPSAGVTALQALRAGGIAPGQRVLINGASGGVGTFAVQIARALGAEVTGVCSTRSVDLVRSLGADHVVDYTREDVTRAARQYDLVLDIAAYRRASDYDRVLAPGGRYLMVGGAPARLFQVMLLSAWRSLTGNRAVTYQTFLKHASLADLVTLKELIEAGKVRPVIDRRLPLRDVPEAIRYLEEEHPRGKVVIAV